MKGWNPAGNVAARQTLLLEAALSYAQLGYAVFPCRRLGKAPTTEYGLKDASRDADTIRKWWQYQPAANVGLLPPKEVVVIDIDNPPLAKRWQLDHPVLRDAPTARTPRGGCHFYLRVPDDLKSPKAHVRVNGEAVDVRGLGKAYLLAPPSRTHHGCYVWERPLLTPHALPIATPTLIEALQPRLPEPKRTAVTLAVQGGGARRYALAALQDECDGVAAALEGSRNATLNKASFNLGQLVATGTLERAEVEGALEAAAAACGLPEGETLRTIRSGLEAGLNQPRDLGQSFLLGQPTPAPNRACSGQAKPYLGHSGNKVHRSK